MFIQGMNTAAARPTVSILPISLASPDAMPPFWIPTSIAIVRDDRSSTRETLQSA
jgi:hypothetical protein